VFGGYLEEMVEGLEELRQEPMVEVVRCLIRERKESMKCFFLFWAV